MGLELIEDALLMVLRTNNGNDNRRFLRFATE